MPHEVLTRMDVSNVYFVYREAWHPCMSHMHRCPGIWDSNHRIADVGSLQGSGGRESIARLIRTE
jgi:hypothetical protein